MAVVDEVSPIEYGQDLIRLSLSSEQVVLRAFEAVLVEADYSLALPADIVLPLELTITSLSGAATFQRHVFTKLRPSVISFVPREGGSHLVRLAEQHHNRWFGSLVVAVEGDPLKGGS